MLSQDFEVKVNVPYARRENKVYREYHIYLVCYNCIFGNFEYDLNFILFANLHFHDLHLQFIINQKLQKGMQFLFHLT